MYLKFSYPFLNKERWQYKNGNSQCFRLPFCTGKAHFVGVGGTQANEMTFGMKLQYCHGARPKIGLYTSITRNITAPTFKVHLVSSWAAMSIRISDMSLDAHTRLPALFSIGNVAFQVIVQLPKRHLRCHACYVCKNIIYSLNTVIFNALIEHY